MTDNATDHMQDAALALAGVLAAGGLDRGTKLAVAVALATLDDVQPPPPPLPEPIAPVARPRRHPARPGQPVGGRSQRPGRRRRAPRGHGRPRAAPTAARAMSYRQEIDSLARHLGAVLATGDPLTGPDLDAAVTGFMTSAQLLRTVHADLVGPESCGPRDLAALDREPIPLLSRLLHDLPALPQSSLTDVQVSPALTGTGTHWRAAVLAHHDRTTALRSSRPAGPAALAEIAQVARVTEALAIAGPGVAAALKDAGRPREAARLHATTTSGLRAVGFIARRSLW